MEERNLLQRIRVLRVGERKLSFKGRSEPTIPRMRKVTWREAGEVECVRLTYMGLSENSVPNDPMVLLIIIPTKWLFHWGYTPFSDIPIYSN